MSEQKKQCVQGKVIDCQIVGRKTYIKVERKVGDGFFVVRANGDVNLTVGSDQVFKDVVLNEDLTTEERKLYDMLDPVKTSDQTFTRMTPDKPSVEKKSEEKFITLDPSVTMMVMSNCYRMASAATNPNIDEQAWIYFTSTMSATKRALGMMKSGQFDVNAVDTVEFLGGDV